MKRGTFSLSLVGPTGDPARWTISAAPTFYNDADRRVHFKPGEYAHTDWVRRILTINSRLRDLEAVYFTLLHEIVHVTAGQNGSEELAINLENNFRISRDKFRNFLETSAQ